MKNLLLVILPVFIARFKDFNAEHPSNALIIVLILDLTLFFKDKFCKEEQPLNI